MNPVKANIPNSITCINLVAGCLAIIAAAKGDHFLWGMHAYQWAFIFIAIGAVADFLDGFAARALHAYSNLGKELDCLPSVRPMRRPAMAPVDNPAYSRCRSIEAGTLQHRHPSDHIFHRYAYSGKRHFLDRICRDVHAGSFIPV